MSKYFSRLGGMDRKIYWLFIFSCLALLSFALIAYQQDKAQEKNRKKIYHTYSIINSLQRFNTALVESESALRSYLITRNPVWTDELYLLQTRLRDSLQVIDTITEGRALSGLPVDSLKSLLDQKIASQDSIANADTLTPVMLAKIGAMGPDRTIKYAMSRLMARIIEAEQNVLTEEIEESERVNTIGRWTALGSGIVVFLLVLFMLYRLNIGIRRHRQAESELVRSEGKYRNLIENAGVVVFTTDIDGKITFTNSHVLKLTGYSSQELIGKHFSLLIDPAWVETVMDFYVRQFQDQIPSTTLQFLARSRTGKEIWVEQFAQVLFDNGHIAGFQCMVRDVTEKKTIELELTKSEHRLQAILDNTPALIFIKDLEGRYIIVNKRFKDMFSLTDDMVLNKTDMDFNPADKADRYLKNDAHILKTLRHIESEEVVETSEGKRTLLVTKFPLLDDKKQAFGVSGIATDITELVQNRQELESALKNVKESKELQEQFLANMSHEIRTPLNGIQGMTSLLLDSPLNEDQKDFVMMIKHSLNNLTAIVNDILDISNIRAGKLMLSKIAFNIIDPIDAVKIQFANQVNRKKLDFSIVLEDNVPKLIIGDPYRLKQVLVSLIDNAIKFTEKGTVSLHVGLKERTAIDTIIEFTIRDTGIGIAADKLNTIFKSFAQANMEISRSFGGAGLGLAISKGLVQMQGGNISVESVPGEGSVFSFYIPYELPQGAEEQSGIGELIAQLKEKHILIVEDNTVNQQLIAFVLQKAGAAIEMVSNGRQAIELLENGRVFDVIIMDLQMPVMDGYETAGYIRNQLQMEIPILALTATALKGDQEKCREMKINDFMLKPFDFTDLYRRLVALINGQEITTPTSATANHRQVKKESRLYDLSMLREMGDDESVLDILSLILSNTAAEIQQLPVLARQQNWSDLFKVSHKAKGSLSVINASEVIQVLANIEKSAREESGLDSMEQRVDKAVQLFGELEKQLREEEQQLKKL